MDFSVNCEGTETELYMSEQKQAAYFKALSCKAQVSKRTSNKATLAPHDCCLLPISLNPENIPSHWKSYPGSTCHPWRHRVFQKSILNMAGLRVITRLTSLITSFFPEHCVLLVEVQLELSHTAKAQRLITIHDAITSD